MEIVFLSGADLEYIASLLGDAVLGEETVRIAIDGGVKVSVSQRMWTPPYGEAPASEEAW